MPVLIIEKVKKSFNDTIILKDINLIVNEGEILGILGGNGSGKTVLIKTLINFFKPDKGQITANGKIGFSMQNNSFYENLTLKENLYYFSGLYKVLNKKKLIIDIINLLDLNVYLNQTVKNLSGGTKKKLDIACALINTPNILILDEPFTGLDSEFIDQLIFFLKRLNKKGMTIIVSSHQMSNMQKLCSRFVYIKDGVLTNISKKSQ